MTTKPDPIVFLDERGDPRMSLYSDGRMIFHQTIDQILNPPQKETTMDQIERDMQTEYARAEMGKIAASPGQPLGQMIGTTEPTSPLAKVEHLDQAITELSRFIEVLQNKLLPIRIPLEEISDPTNAVAQSPPRESELAAEVGKQTARVWWLKAQIDQTIREVDL